MLTDTVGIMVYYVYTYISNYIDTISSLLNGQHGCPNLLTSSSPLGTVRVASLPNATHCNTVPMTSSLGSADRCTHVVQVQSAGALIAQHKQ